MGFLDSFLGREQNRVKDICIPEHVLKKQGIVHEKKPENEEQREGNLFEIEGIYEPIEGMLLTGKAVSGRIRKGAKCKNHNMEFSISEITVGKNTVSSLEKGESGILMLKCKKHPILRVGDIIEF